MDTTQNTVGFASDKLKTLSLNLLSWAVIKLICFCLETCIIFMYGQERICPSPQRASLFLTFKLTAVKKSITKMCKNKRLEIVLLNMLEFAG